MNDAINHMACETLFTQARTHNGWLDKPVSDAQLQAVWDLMKMGPTSANCSPARILSPIHISPDDPSGERRLLG